MKTVDLTWKQVAAWRAGRHRLTAQRAPASALLDVVAEQGGVHAQVMTSAELSLWARLDGLQPGDVARGLWEDRTLVKAWAMRGTLHLLPSAEYRLWQAVLNEWRFYEKPYWLRGFGVTAEELDQLITAVGEALARPTPLTRVELGEAVTERTGSVKLGEKVSGSWGSMLKPAAYQGLLCFAPNAGQNVRFTRPDQWLDLGPPVDAGQAALEITRRFLARYGPATREDYAHWWGAISPAEAGRRIAGLGDDVAAVTVAGQPAWQLAADVPEAAAATPPRTARLLPAFDQYVITASTHADNLLAAPARARIYRPQGWLSPVVIVNGMMSGIWKHERKRARVLVTVEPFVTLPGWARKGVEQEAERLAAYLGATLDLTVRPA